MTTASELAGRTTVPMCANYSTKSPAGWAWTWGEPVFGWRDRTVTTGFPTWAQGEF